MLNVNGNYLESNFVGLTPLRTKLCCLWKTINTILTPELDFKGKTSSVYYKDLDLQG